MGFLEKHGWCKSHLHRHFPLGTFRASEFFSCASNRSSEIKLAARLRYLYAATDFTN
jgi:hypothetical protein